MYHYLFRVNRIIRTLMQTRVQDSSLFNDTTILTSSWWSLTAIVFLGVSGVPFQRPLDFRRNRRRRGDVGALHLETILVRYPIDADLLAVRCHIRVLATRDYWCLLFHLPWLATFLMANPIARLKAAE